MSFSHALIVQSKRMRAEIFAENQLIQNKSAKSSRTIRFFRLPEGFFHKSFWFSGFAVTWLLVGCGGENEIQVYRISKETNPTDSSAPFANMGSMPGLTQESPAATSGNQSPIHWNSPGSWTEKQATGMRMGSFTIEGPEGSSADVSIIPLSGPAGGLVSNINRWRRQDVMLPEITEADLDEVVMELETQMGPMKIIDMVSEEALIDDKFKQRVLAAIFPFQGQTWFVKAKGPAELLEAQKEAFVEFLASFHDGTDHDH